MIKIDNITWDVPCKIVRKAEIKGSEISGLMLDGSYFNDVLGTYMSYTVAIAAPMNMLNEYGALYEALSDPYDGHEFVLPYNQGSIWITGRVVSVQDTHYQIANGVYWEGCTFDVVANHPSKSMTLSGVITRGRTPIPPQTSYPDGDERYY